MLLSMQALTAEEVTMAVITVRNLDDDVQRRLRVRAAAHGRSMEAEAREILTAAVTDSRMIVDWVEAARAFAVDLDLPTRTLPRDIGLS